MVNFNTKRNKIKTIKLSVDEINKIKLASQRLGLTFSGYVRYASMTMANNLSNKKEDE